MQSAAWQKPPKTGVPKTNEVSSALLEKKYPPCIIRLVREAPVFDQAVPVGVELHAVLHGRAHRLPAVARKLHVARRHEVAVHLPNHRALWIRF